MAKGIGKCILCQELVIRSIDCADCGTNYHHYCIVQTKPDPESNMGRCKACHADVVIHSTTTNMNDGQLEYLVDQDVDIELNISFEDASTNTFAGIVN